MLETQDMFANATMMITGGTGSFGHAVLKRLLDSPLAEIRIFSRDEKKQDDMRKLLANDRVKFVIGDVRDRDSVGEAMRGVHFVFHAAALKQVPSCEFYPMEAIRTNVLGTENVIQAAINAGTRRVVVLSTDKAVYPINAMGMSKALAEKVMTARARSVGHDTVLCATRYGNVMASRGSVIPLFIDQLRSNRPLTVTDPSMTRFMMSLEESVDLVLHAFTHAEPGDIFVQKSPAATMDDLAVAVREVFGRNDAALKIIGTRHGEKLYETLVAREEMAKAIDQGRYFRIPADDRSLNYDAYFVAGEARISESGDYTSHNTRRLDVAGIKQMLLSLDYIQQELPLLQRASPAT